MDNNEFQQQQPQTNEPQFEAPLSMGEWLVTLILLMIPCVNIVLLFVWGFGNGNVSRRNYCRATLIVAAAGIVLSLLFSASIMTFLAGAINSGGYGY